jgi:hypothetical protein
MPQSLRFKLAELKNLDRLLIRSMLAMVEFKLTSSWVESTTAGAELLIADADTPAGRVALLDAQGRGLITVALTEREVSPFTFSIRKPAQTKPLMDMFNAAADLLLNSGPHKQRMQRAGLGAVTQQNVPAVAKRGGNLFDYLSQPEGRGIVEVRFAPGKTVIFNHPLGEYCTSLSESQLLNLARLPIQETQHGMGQSTSEWNIAKRVLPTKSLEDLTWRILREMSGGLPIPAVENLQFLRLTRLPRLTQALGAEELGFAKFLTRNPVTPHDAQRACQLGPSRYFDFINAAYCCGLLETSVETVSRKAQGAMPRRAGAL